MPALGSDLMNNFVNVNNAGIDYEAIARQVAQARGKNPANLSDQWGITTEVVNRIGNSDNMAEEAAKVSYGAGMASNTNYFRSLVGQPQISTDYFSSPYFLDNPNVADQARRSMEFFGEQALTNRGYYQNALAPIQAQNDAMASSVNGADLANSQICVRSEHPRASITSGSATGLIRQAAGDQIVQMANPAFSDENRTQWGQLATGNKYALSKAVQYGFIPNQGQTSLKTMNISTGMGIFDTGGFDAQDFQQLAGNDPYGQFRIDQAEFMQDGIRGLRNSQRVESYANEDYQRLTGMRQQALNYQLQTGFSMAGGVQLDAQGFAANGGGQDVLQAIMSQFNLPFNPGNGMSLYQVDDAQTRLSREQQLYNQSQTTQSNALARQNFALQGQQFYENWNLSQDQFNFQTGYQREQMSFQRGQQQTQEGWQREDLAFNRDQMEIHNAWRMEDYDRNIRYARGRDKRDLIREQGRATIEYAMQAGQQDRQENRQETREGWSQQVFEKEKGYFEQNVQFQQQRMDLQKKHFEEDRALQEQRLKMTEEAHTKQIGWLQQQFSLEDQQRLLTRQAAEAQRSIQQDVNQHVLDYTNRQRALNDAIGFANQRTEEWNAKISVMAVNGTLASIATAAFNAALSQVPANATKAAANVQNYSTGTYNPNTANSSSGTYNPNTVIGLPPPSNGGTQGATGGRVTPTQWADGGHVGSFQLTKTMGMTQWASDQFAESYIGHQVAGSFADGGSTGNRPLNEPVGVVHGGEFVVPSNGALVLRDDDLISLMRKVVELLQRHSEILTKISNNPTTFQANFNGAISQPEDIYQQARAAL